MATSYNTQLPICRLVLILQECFFFSWSKKQSGLTLRPGVCFAALFFYSTFDVTSITGTAATARPLYAIAVSTFSNSRKFLKQKVHQGLCNWLVKIEWKFYLRKSFSIGIVKARFQTTDIVKTTWQSFFFSTTFSITKCCYKVLVSFCPFYFNT